MNQAGVAPEEAASWALKAIDGEQFWALPPESDIFSDLLAAELDEIRPTRTPMHTDAGNR